MRPRLPLLAVIASLDACTARSQGPSQPPSDVLWNAKGPSLRSGATSLDDSLVFLHGAGEKGNGTTERSPVLAHGPPKLIQSSQSLPFIVVSPQLPASQGDWPVTLVDELIVKARFDDRVDTTRIYVTGSITMVNALNACLPAPSVTPQLTTYPGVGHDSWTRTYDGSAGHDIFAWLLNHHR